MKERICPPNENHSLQTVTDVIWQKTSSNRWCPPPIDGFQDIKYHILPEHSSFDSISFNFLASPRTLATANGWAGIAIDGESETWFNGYESIWFAVNFTLYVFRFSFRSFHIPVLGLTVALAHLWSWWKYCCCPLFAFHSANACNDKFTSQWK